MPTPIALTRAELALLDRLAVLEYGLPSIVLMENAGRGAAEILERRLAARGLHRARVVIACGPGNNGGDGYVVARHLANAGHDVALLASARPEDLRGDAATMRNVVEKMQLEVLPAWDGDEPLRSRGDAPMPARGDAPMPARGDAPAGEREERLAGARAALARADLVVDALLGTGFTGGHPRPAIARRIELVRDARAAGRTVVALDLPSGLDADTGVGARPCVQADLTITFAAPKTGFAAADAARYTGEVVVAGIGAPRELAARVAAARRARGE